MNLLRLAFYLVGSDIYSVKLAKEQSKRNRRWHLPTVSVLIPVHNEERVIERAMKSVYESNYPSHKLELIVCNDGSTDASKQIIKNFRSTHRRGCTIRYINRPQKGKAAVLNYGLRRLAKHQLIMCLDADSYLEKNALRNAVQHFRDRKVIALSSNVNIITNKSILGWLQRIEYLVCYQMKKSQAQFQVEYIVGGIGSMFRKNHLKSISYYDTNTMTEDIDLTLKMLVNKKRHEKIGYAADSIVYTEPVTSFADLKRQRYRWKYGRNQTFLKNSQYIFSSSDQHNKRVAWFMIPFALLQDVLFFLEPFVIIFFLYNLVMYGDLTTLMVAFTVVNLYVVINIMSTQHINLQDKTILALLAPVMYGLMYILSFAEYLALIMSVKNLPKLRSSLYKKHTVWKSPIRTTS